jgi:hypothetical protein
MKSLDRREIKLGDWVANKKGIRSKKEWWKKREDERRGMGDRPVIKTTPLEKEKMRRLKGIGLRKQAAKIDENKRGEKWVNIEEGTAADLQAELKRQRRAGHEAEVFPKALRKQRGAGHEAEVFPKALRKQRGAGHEAEVFPKALRKREDKPTRRGDERITIKSGDTLSDLAKARGTTLAAIRRANPGRFPTAKSLNIIKAGEKINMPPNVGATTPYDTKTVRVKPKVVPTQKVRKEDKSSVKLEPFSGGVATAVRPPLKPLEGGIRYKKLPDWLGGGEIKIDSSDEAFNYDNPDNVTHGKRGGQVKKGVKKTKAKARRRAALRGHRAELRGG